jgi:hypothetical protein
LRFGSGLKIVSGETKARLHRVGIALRLSL